MKRIVSTLGLSLMAPVALAQGLVNFENTPTTLVSAVGVGNFRLLSGPPGTYLFGLLTSPAPTGPFTFSGLYASNIVSTSGGRFSGGNGVAVNGWAPGTTMFFEIFGWASSEGTTFNPAWVRANGTSSFGLPPISGISAIGSGVAGGGPQSLPPLPLFQAVSGIQAGFDMEVPEPTTMTLAGLAAAGLLIFRRRK